MIKPSLEMMHRIAEAAEQAATLIMQYYQQDVSVEHKEDASPVTEADRAADVFLRQQLEGLAPWPIVSEEGDKPDVSQAEYFWLVDPLDGTKSFIRRRGDFTVNIGLIHKGIPIMGALVQPVTGDSYCGLVGEGAFHRKGGEWKPIGTRIWPATLDILVSHSHYSKRTEDFLKSLPEYRTYPQSSSIKFAVVAEGKADCYPRFGETSEWDTAAGDALLRAAGGMTYFVDGKPFTYAKAQFRNPDFIAWGKKPV